jgi:hypothetical protein
MIERVYANEVLLSRLKQKTLPLFLGSVPQLRG